LREKEGDVKKNLSYRTRPLILKSFEIYEGFGSQGIDLKGKRWHMLMVAEREVN